MPVLAANLILDKEPEWQKETHIQPSVVLSKNGTKIGIIGYLTPDTKFISPRNNIEYEDEVFAITREVKKLKRQGVNILIALGHSGYITDIRIARDVPDLDLVIGGHSHTLLWNNNSTDEKPEIPQGPYPTIVKQSSGREVLVVQAYAFTKYMGELHLIFDSNGEIIQYDGEPLLLDQKVPRDPELLESVNKYRKEFDEDNNEVVGSSLVFLDGNKCRLRECNMGDFITDTILKYSIEKLGKSDITVAVIQGGRIRASIDSPEKPFQLTKGDWITVLPFMDSLVAVAANGSVLLQSLEHSVAAWRTIDSSGQFLQYSGLEVTYDLAKPPGSRVVKARAVCSTCGNNFTDIKDNYEYKIIMSDYLANNGDGFTMFQLLNREKLFYTEIDSVLEYLHKYGSVNYSESGRITILNEDKVLGNVPEVTRDTIKNERYLPSNGAILGQNYIVLLGMFSCYIYFVLAEM